MLPPINQIKDPRRYYGQQVDMWLLGCIIFNMVTGVPPFYVDSDVLEKHDSEIYEHIRAGEWREKLE